MNDQLGILDEVEKFGGNFGKKRLVLQEFQGDAVNFQCSGVDFAFGVQVAVEMPVGQATVAHFDAADFDDAMPELVFEAGGFSVEEDLAHGGRGCKYSG